MIEWERLIKERNEWVAHNFPEEDKDFDEQGQPTCRVSLLGMIEEIGELTHHYLKEDQNIRGTPEYHREEARDAIGDITVYLLGVMKVTGPPETEIILAVPLTLEKVLFKLSFWTGLLADDGVHANPEVTNGRVSGIVYFLSEYCNIHSWDYDDIVNSTWEKVQKRDWQADRSLGGEPLPAQGDTQDIPRTPQFPTD